MAEETHCWICGDEVDKALTMAWGQHGPRCKGDGCPGCVPHPMRAEVDEVVPVKDGGSPFDRGNCRLAHRECNRRRTENRSRPEPIVEEPFPISDCWGGIFDLLKA